MERINRDADSLLQPTRSLLVQRRDCLSHREPALIERPADDRPAASQITGSDEVLDAADAAGGDDRAPSEPDRPLEETKIRPTEQPVAVNCRDLEGRDARVRELLDGLLRADPGGAGTPAVAERETVTDIDRGSDPIGAVALHQPRREAGIAEGRGADDGSRGAGGERPVDGRIGAQTAGHLAPNALPHPLDDRLDDIDLDRLAGAGPIEVDDVKPRGPRVGEGLGDRERIVGVAGLAGEVTLA